MTNEPPLEYRILVHHEAGSLWAEVEELPGCFATGDTMDELWEALTEAVSFYLSTDDEEVVAILERPEVATEEMRARVLVS